MSYSQDRHNIDTFKRVTQRVDAARSRINALNPRVEVVASTDMQQLSDEASLSEYDLVILSDSDAATIVSTVLAIQHLE